MTLDGICEKLIVNSTEGLPGEHRAAIMEMIANKLQELKNPYIATAVKDYARQKCKEQREICDANKKLIHDYDPVRDEQFSYIDSESIRNAPEPNFD